MRIEVNGIRGLYEEVGDGPPLVLIASPVALAKTYRPTAKLLARTFRVFTLELPGSGRAERLSRSWGVEDYAAWVAGFIRRRGLSRPVVIGHSHSASIAVILAARHAGMVGRLIVVDATGTGPHRAMRVFVGGLYDLLLDIRLVLRAWHHVARNPFLHPANFARQVRDSLTLDLRADIARVTVPTLVAWGRRDHTFPPRHAGEYARLLPDARVYLSPTGCHDWVISQAAEFAGVVSPHSTGRPRSCPIIAECPSHPIRSSRGRHVRPSRDLPE